MRIFRTSALTAAAATVALVLPAGAAVAAPGTDCPTAGNGGAYPGASCALQVSDSSVRPGEPVTVSGSDFQPGTTYTITLHSTPTVLATGTARSSTITRSVTIPADTAPGDHELILTGTDNEGGPRRLVSAITVVGTLGSTQSEGVAGSTTGMPNTGAGSNLLPLLGAGGGLVIVGAGVVVASRRRRYSDQSS